MGRDLAQFLVISHQWPRTMTGFAQAHVTAPLWHLVHDNITLDDTGHGVTLAVPA